MTALIERERDRVAHHLEQAAKSADGPLAAVEAWIDAFLDLLYNPEIAPTTAIFTAPRSWPPTPWPRPCPRCSACSVPRSSRPCGPGHRAGVLKSSTPEADAYCIHALVHAALDVHHRARLPKRAVVKAQILRFAWPALGLRLKRT